MPAVYLKDFKEELRKVGDVVFKQRYRAPVLIVTGRTGDFVDEASGDKTMVAAPSDKPAEQVALLDRVFVVTKAAHAPRGPVVLGRSSDNDIPIPEFSISKRHCAFSFEPEGIKVTDYGSTNGTVVGDTKIEPKEAVLIRDGSTLALGRFVFAFRTAAGFHAHVKSLLR